MNREILFKAKRVDNGKWAEGYYCKTDLGTFINQYRVDYEFESTYLINYEVIPETVCQYTGLTDKNGKKIFERDIVEFEDTGEDGYEYKEGFEFNNQAIIVYKDNRFILDDFSEDENSGYANDEWAVLNELLIKGNCLEVIGSIHDKTK